MVMELLLAAGLLFPLIGFLILLASSEKISRKLTGFIGCSSILLAFVCFVYLLVTLLSSGNNALDVTLFNWLSFPMISADFALRADSLSLFMTLIITGVGFLIHLYSNGYMEHDADYARFFACMNFFVFAMLLLVLAKNLLLLFVGWEGVGLASYLLIGFWYERPEAASAATKAFVVNRIGDFGFFLGLLMAFFLFGTSDLQILAQQATLLPKDSPVLAALALLLFVGACGKSAQLPLQTWLPDAMAGPTPVSALIHAATMVTAGVYLVVRLHVLFLQVPTVLLIVGTVGAITALFAALCALAQTDLKKVLAYSTMSQLGYMFLACGVGAYFAAMFHLMTHAFVKALLFLSAGNVIHALDDETDMNNMGGLYAYLRTSRWLFLIGALAMSGVPPLAIFFSKDLILEESYQAGFYVLYGIGLFTAVLTAFYMMRAYCLTFLGKTHLTREAIAEVHEAPKIMTGPVAVLACLAIAGGFLGFALGHPPILEQFLAKSGVAYASKELLHGYELSLPSILAICGSLLGLLAGYIVYAKFAERIGSTIKVLARSFYVDELYWTLLVTPFKGVAKLIAYAIEPWGFHLPLEYTAKGAQEAARGLQHMQSGQIRSYLAWMVIGTVCIVGLLIY